MSNPVAHLIEGHVPALLGAMLLAAAIAAAVFVAFARRRAAARAAAEAANLRQLADAAMEGLVILDGARALDANRAFLRMAGFLGDVLQPCPVAELFPGLDLRALAAAGAGVTPVEARLANPRGRDRTVELRLRGLVWNGAPAQALAVRDVTETREAAARLNHVAYRDQLTGLPNRACFLEELSHAVATARTGERIAVLVADLQDFRALNALHGETVGDSLLTQAAERIRKITREDDLAARIGGDEFGLIQYGGTEPGHAFLLAGRIQQALDRPLRAGTALLRTHCAIGVAFYPEDGTDPTELLRRAGQALAYAKAAGAAVRAYEPKMDEAVRERRQLARDLQHAVVKHQLSLHYQPVADAATGRIVGFEALCRWEHPRRGAVPPALFVPLAEETGFMPMLGEWVLRQACAEAARWAMPVAVSVNLSPVQFAQGDLAATVAAILAETGLAPERLDLEVTEAILTGDSAAALATLQRLAALGVSVSLDDFGTGASSLNSLRRFPFRRLKIDPCFTREVAASDEARAIVRAVIGMARGLGMAVVAEGVEDDAQLETLRAEGCDLVQGYAVSRPRANGAFTLSPAGREMEAA